MTTVMMIILFSIKEGTFLWQFCCCLHVRSEGCRQNYDRHDERKSSPMKYLRRRMKGDNPRRMFNVWEKTKAMKIGIKKMD